MGKKTSSRDKGKQNEGEEKEKKRGIEIGVILSVVEWSHRRGAGQRAEQKGRN